MADDNFLAEKEFDISIDGQTHKVKATAVFLVHGVEPQEVGIYLLDFTLRGQSVETSQPDKTYYTREQANARSKVGLILATEGLFVDDSLSKTRQPRVD